MRSVDSEQGRAGQGRDGDVAEKRRTPSDTDSDTDAESKRPVRYPRQTTVSPNVQIYHARVSSSNIREIQGGLEDWTPMKARDGLGSAGSPTCFSRH